ncbi:hypothetical protein MVES1_002738 [Malassezia vespertilionis]|uniref:nitric oxide dioxygenase n=1 Tax=Malassezia vespertilionis TaxID=2020962 RepID=A0A2N1JAU2_9BASI|nr:uncharacterized protein MVES1_002738 [Malassezia vespertilionis]PKI83671.1 hypothetical protein MVES_002585 [Malassezia vespertilionis]WFD07374.1 hypothetical protein MVES1_002738 [Malassezia vespertilionis]
MESCRAQLKPEEADVVRATLPLIGANIEKITTNFYGTLFEENPSLLNDLFNRGNQKQGAQQRALAGSIAKFASLLVAPAENMPADLLSRIGHKHAVLGIVEDHYPIVYKYLFGAIVHVLGADVVTADVAAAWTSVFWILANVLITFEKELYKGAGVQPGKVFRQAKVVDRDDRSANIVSFTVESTDAFNPFPKHLAGQYVSVVSSLPDGARQIRQYSLMDACENPGQLRFAVKALQAQKDAPAGEVSNWLAKEVKVGTELAVSLPFGDLILDTESQRPVVLISSGIGITPMFGMLARFVADRSSRKIVAIHCDQDMDGDAFYKERLHMVSQLSSGEAMTWHSVGEVTKDVKVGRMDIASLTLPTDAQFYICGGTNFLKSICDGLRKIHVPEEDLHFELFTPNDWLL